MIEMITISRILHFILHSNQLSLLKEKGPCKNRVKSLLSMREPLLGDSLKSQAKSR